MLLLPPNSPDLNPTEQALANPKARLRTAAGSDVHGPWNAIGRILDLLSPQERADYFANAGYDADRPENA